MSSERVPMDAYHVPRVHAKPELRGLWDGPAWSAAGTVKVAHFYGEAIDHRPRTRAKLLYDDEALYVHFLVEDRYVLATQTEYNAMVCRDSCAEFFVEPRADSGYFNFEVNCGGTLHLSYIEDATRTPEGFAKFVRVPEKVGGRVRVFHTMPERVEPEITEPTTWQVEYAIPWDVFETYVGPLGTLSGQGWRANFYKCADDSSHPHWASWAPIQGALNFHQPQYFAPIIFE